MRKTSTILVSVLLLISFSTALDARIDESDSGQSTVDVVLKPSNNYSYTANYSSTTSTGDIKNSEWTLVGTDQTDSGVGAQFDFDRGMEDPENVKLVVSDGNTADDFQISQPVQDIPNTSITADKTAVKTGETVTFSSSVTNSFDSPVSYSWKGDVSGKSSTLQTSFSSAGSKTVKLKVTDSAGYSSTTQPITVQVNGENSPSNPSGGGGGGAGLGALPSQNQKNDQNKTEPQEKKNKTDSSSKERPQNDRKSVVAESKNGVARVNITKGEDVNTINVRVNPASNRTGVNSISITAGNASRNVSVSVQNLGRKKPQQVPEPAASEESNVYSYQEINTSMNDSDIDLAEIDFSVNKSWIDERNRSREDVVMKRFTNGSWEYLDTRYINSTDNELNFEASSEGFSYYAVALRDSEVKMDGTPLLKEKFSSQQSNRVFYIVAIMLMSILAFVGYWKREMVNDRLNQISFS